MAREHGEPRGGRPTKQTGHSAKAQGTRGRRREKARDRGGAKKKPQAGGGGRKKRQGPRHPGLETKESKRQRGARGGENKRGGGRGGETRGGPTKDQERGNTSREGAEQSRKTKRPEEKVRRTKTRPGGQPARPDQEGRAHAHPDGTRAWRPSTRKGRCRRQHETAPVHQPSPPSKDGRYGKLDASVTGSTHSNHRSARSPRPTPEGPARDNPIAGPRTGTARSEPSAPASLGASGRHNDLSSRPASACPAQLPSKYWGESPGDGERHHGVGKADWSTESDRTGRGAADHAGPRGTPERHAAGHNHGTRTDARQQRLPGAPNPDSAHHNHTTTAKGQHRREDEAKQRQRDQTPRTGSSGVGQPAGTAAPRKGASRDQRRWTPPGLKIPGCNKQQAPRGATEAATRTRPRRSNEAEWRTRPGRSGEDKMRTRPR